MTVTPDPVSEIPETPEKIRQQMRTEIRIYLVIVAVVSLLVGGIMGRYLFGVNTPEEDVKIDESTPLLRQDTFDVPVEAYEQAYLSVYVSGAVSVSKVVTLPAGSLVVDAIQAVGGAASDADLDALNLAAPLYNHDHVIVPMQNDQSPLYRSDIMLDINTATKTELETLPNIGPARAEQIVTFRENQGPFKTKQDIMKVTGIGQVIYTELAPYIYVGDE